jgi:biopolymer transport protein ExbD
MANKFFRAAAALLGLWASAARADNSAAAPAGCERVALRFAPTPGARYTVETWEENAPRTDASAAYRSALVFTRRPNGWLADESDFRRPHVPPEATGFSDARLRWRLDERGLPLGAPEVQGGGDPDVVRNLSLFAFRPMGLTVRATCVDAKGESSFTDAAGRTRAYAFQIVARDGATVTLMLDGGVRMASGTRWAQRGTLHLDLADGLTGDAQLTERGPAPSAERQRTVIVTHAENTSRAELRIDLGADGTLYCDGARSTLAAIRESARAGVAAGTLTRAILAADRSVPHGKVVELLDALKAAGVTKIAFLVGAPEPTAPPR